MRILGIEGIGVNYQNVSGRSVLHESARHKKVELVKWLLRDGYAKVGLTDRDGNTALHLAIQQKSEDIVRLLLEAGADIKAKNAESKSSLQMARDLGHESPILWQLTHRPSLCGYAFHVKKPPLEEPTPPTEEDAKTACEQHIVSAIEVFEEKGYLREP